MRREIRKEENAPPRSIRGRGGEEKSPIGVSTKEADSRTLVPCVWSI